MIVEYIRYELDQARAPALVDAYRIAAEQLRASPHCLGFELTRCTERGKLDAYILRIEWDSAEGHLRGFRGGQEFPQFFAAIGPFVGDIREMRHYEPTGLEFERATSEAAAR